MYVTEVILEWVGPISLDTSSYTAAVSEIKSQFIHSFFCKLAHYLDHECQVS